MINALVIDVEHWYSPELIRDYLPLELVDQFPESIMPILELLEKYGVHATFAVLGIVAQEHPEIIKEIYDRGHEIASHCWSHKTLYELGKDGFEDELARSTSLLESITGERPIGFRAPSFSINASTSWAFEVLEKFDFKYDSSIFPIETMLYGVPNAPHYIYRPSQGDILKHDSKGKIVEFPMTVLNIGKNIPICGGFYLRLFPLWFVKYGIKLVNKSRPAIVYIHPWETYSGTPKIGLPHHIGFINYYNCNTTIHKIEKLLCSFNFAPIKDVLHLCGKL